MSFLSYKKIALATHIPIRVDDDVYCVPDFTRTGAGIRVSLTHRVIVERRRVEYDTGNTVLYICSCPYMKAYRESLDSSHLYPQENLSQDPCYHVRLVLETEDFADPAYRSDSDVVKIEDALYLVQRTLVRKTRRGLLCTGCKHNECPHVRRLETAAIESPGLEIRVEDVISGGQGTKRSGPPEDAITVPQQKITLAPDPKEQGKRYPNRSRTVARIYDIGGWREYQYQLGETLDHLRGVCTDGIFRYSREVWFTHALISLYIDNVAKGNPCFDAFHHTMTLQYARVDQHFCSKPTTRTVLQASFHHLDLDVTSALSCPECSSLPVRHRIFILDGTSNGFLDRSKSQRKCTGVYHKKPQPGSVFCLVKSTKYRGIVLGDMEPKDAYIKKLCSVPVPGLVEFVTHALDHCSHAAVGVFLSDIASPYPIIRTVQRDMVLPGGGLLERLYGSISREDRDTLRRVWPSLYGLLPNCTSIPRQWRRLLQTIRDLALESYHTSDTEYLTWTRATEERDSVCFPEFPRLRENPWPRQASTYEKEQSCTKHILQHKYFSPGLFLICCPHAKILGFCAMQEYESVHTAFELIVERFDIPPGMIIYDNGCNLFRYGMMRCPGLFSQITILIDKFHSPGHVLCPPSFTFQYYPDDVEVMLGAMQYKTLNTQAVEQTNGRLRKFQKTLGFMTEDNYITFVRVVACLLNKYSV